MALTYAFAIALILLLFIELLRAKRNNFKVNHKEAVQLINREHAAVIDIRPLDAYRGGHIIDSVSLPSSELLTSTKRIEKYRTKPLIIVCQAGIESQKIAATLAKQGYNVRTLTGGLRAWSEADLPLVKG